MSDADHSVPLPESLSDEKDKEYKKTKKHHAPPHRSRNVTGNIVNKKKLNNERVRCKETKEVSKHKRSTDEVAEQCRRLDLGAALSWHSGDESGTTINSKIDDNNSHHRENNSIINNSNNSSVNISNNEMYNLSNNSSHTISSHNPSSSFNASTNNTLQHSYDKRSNTNKNEKKKKEVKKKKKKKNKVMKHKVGSYKKDKDQKCDETDIIIANNAKGKENHRLSETERLRLRYMSSFKQKQNIIMEEGQHQGLNNLHDKKLTREFSDKTAFLCASDAALRVETERKWYDMPYSLYMQKMLATSTTSTSSTAGERTNAKRDFNDNNDNGVYNDVITVKGKVNGETKRSGEENGNKNSKSSVAEVRVSEHGFSVGLPFQYETTYSDYTANEHCNVNTNMCNCVNTSNCNVLCQEYTYNGNCSRAHTLLVDGWLTNTHYPCLVREFAITPEMLQTALHRVIPILKQAVNEVLCFNIHVDWNATLCAKRNSTDQNKNVKQVLQVDDAFLELLFRNLQEYLPIVEYKKVMKRTATKTKAKSKKLYHTCQHDRKETTTSNKNNHVNDDVVIVNKDDHTQEKLFRRKQTQQRELLEELTLESENDECESSESRVAQELAYDALHSESSLSAPLSLETTQLMPITAHVDHIYNSSSNKSKTSNWHERSSSSAAQWWNNLYEHLNDDKVTPTTFTTEQLEQQEPEKENDVFSHEHDEECCSGEEEQHNRYEKQEAGQDLTNGEELDKIKHVMHVHWESRCNIYEHACLYNEKSGSNNNKAEIVQMPILALHVMRVPEEQIKGDECTEKMESTENEKNVGSAENKLVNNNLTKKEFQNKTVNSTLYKHRNAITRYETITRALAKNDDSKSHKTKETITSANNNNNITCDESNFCIIVALALPLIWQGSVSEFMHCVHECHVDYWTKENILRRWVKSLLPQLVQRHECKQFHGNLSAENWFDASNITFAMYDIISELNQAQEREEELVKGSITQKQEMHQSRNEHWDKNEVSEQNNVSKVDNSNAKINREEFTSPERKYGGSHNVTSQNASISASHITHSPLEHIRRHFSLSFSHDEKKYDETPFSTSHSPLESFSESSSLSSSSSSERAEETISHVKERRQKRTSRAHTKITTMHTSNHSTAKDVSQCKEKEEQSNVNYVPRQSGICIADDYYEIVELAIAMTIAERVLSNVLLKIDIKEQFHLQSYQTKETLAEQELLMTTVANNNNNSNCMEHELTVLQTIVNRYVNETILESGGKNNKKSGRELHMFTLEKSEDIPAPECIRPEFSDKHAKNTTNNFSSDKSNTDNNKECTTQERQNNVGYGTSPFRKSKNNLLPYSLLSDSVDVWQFGVSLLRLASVSGELPSWCYYEHNPILSLECLQAQEGELEQQNNWENSSDDGKQSVKRTWSSEFATFVDRCLETNPLLRPSFAELLNDPWLLQFPLFDASDKEQENTFNNYKSESQSKSNEIVNNEPNAKRDKKSNAYTKVAVSSSKSKCRNAKSNKQKEEKEYYKAWWQNNVKGAVTINENFYKSKEDTALPIISSNTPGYANTYYYYYDDIDDDRMSRKIMTYIISHKTSKVSSLSSLPSLLLPLSTKGSELVAFHYNIKQCCSAMVHGNSHVLRPNYTRLRELYVALVGQDKVDVNRLLINNSSFQLSRNLMQRQRSLANSINYGSLTGAAAPATTFALNTATTITANRTTKTNTDKIQFSKEKSMRNQIQRKRSINKKKITGAEWKHELINNEDNEENSTNYKTKTSPNASECNVSNFTDSYCSNSYRPLQHSWSRSINKSLRTNEAQPFRSSSSLCITSQLMLSILLDRYGVHVQHEPSLSNSHPIPQNTKDNTRSSSAQALHDTNINNSSLHQTASYSRSMENNLEQTKAFYDLNEVNVLISAEEQEGTEVSATAPAETIGEVNEAEKREQERLAEEKEPCEVNEENSVQGLTNAHHSPFLCIMSATLFDCERALRGAMKNDNNKTASNENDDDDDNDDDDVEEGETCDNEESEKTSRLRDGIFAVMQSFWALHEQAPIAVDIWGVLLLHALSDNTATLELLSPLFDTLLQLPIQENKDAHGNAHNRNERINTDNSASNSVSNSMENSPTIALNKRQISLVDGNTRHATVLIDENAHTMDKIDSNNRSSCLIKTPESRKTRNNQFATHARNYKTNKRGNDDNKKIKTTFQIIDPSLFHCYQSCKWYNASSMLLDAADHSQ